MKRTVKGKTLCSNSKRRSRSSKAGLKFPVARISRFLKVGKYVKLVGVGAPIFLVVVIEYLAVEVLELTGIAARNDKKTLYQFLRDVTIPNGGVIKKIHKILLPNTKRNTSKVVVATV
uniref:Histone H2A n=1 Tax=Solanum lycopersicum TaxID=4081 RepID=A0A3Q7GI71_SOLLC